jgi:SAM-dependent methyltransferase
MRSTASIRGDVYAHPDPTRSIRAAVSIGTELVTFLNRKNRRLVGFHDYPIDIQENRQWMIVLPGFGETKTEVLAESYYLARNGFNTLRFDYSNHIGESEGNIADTNLEDLKDDILSGLDYVCEKYGSRKIGAVASSLAARALFRAGREDTRLALLISLVSVVDLQKTLYAIYREDFLERVKRGESVEVMDVLGFQIDAGQFLRSAIANSYDNLQSTIEDVRNTNAPVVFFAAERDAWVDLSDVQQLIYAKAGRRQDLHILDGAMHELQEKPEVSRAVLRGVVRSALHYLCDSGDTELAKPTLKEIGFRNRKEKLRNKIIYESRKDNEREFWKSYLDKYTFVVNVPDYWELLTLINSLLRLEVFLSDELLLDAGCGIGNFGTYALVKKIYTARQNIFSSLQPPSLRYVGVDFVADALKSSRRTHKQIEREFQGSVAGGCGREFLKSNYVLADLDFRLPLNDNSVGAICCNLVISYLQDPGRTIRDLVRLLKPGGRIVITSLKPFADMSQVYRNFIKIAKCKSDIDEARKLLSNAGRIKVKEAHGVYEFFSEDALVKLMNVAGLSEIETFRSLGDQANVAVGLKLS